MADAEPENAENPEAENTETPAPENAENPEPENVEETSEANKDAPSENPAEPSAEASKGDSKIMVVDDQSAPFKASVNVEYFTPEEVKVSIRNEIRTIVIEARHFETKDGVQSISKEFTRKFTVPNLYNLNNMTHKIENSVLFIEIPIDCKTSVKCSTCNDTPERPKGPEFKAEVNVATYRPDEISVNLNPETRMVSVEAKHMDRSQNMMFVARQFTRKFSIPPRYMLNEMYHEIQDGVLSIHIPIDPTMIKDKDLKSVENTEKPPEIKPGETEPAAEGATEAEAAAEPAAEAAAEPAAEPTDEPAAEPAAEPPAEPAAVEEAA